MDSGLSHLQIGLLGQLHTEAGHWAGSGRTCTVALALISPSPYYRNITRSHNHLASSNLAGQSGKPLILQANFLTPLTHTIHTPIPFNAANPCIDGQPINGQGVLPPHPMQISRRHGNTPYAAPSAIGPGKIVHPGPPLAVPGSKAPTL